MKLKIKYMKLKNGKEIKREDLNDKTKNYKYSFQQYETVRWFGEFGTGKN